MRIKHQIKEALNLIIVIILLLLFLKLSSLVLVLVLLLLWFLFSKDNLFFLALFLIMLNEPLNIPFRKFAFEAFGSPIKFQYVFYITAFVKWILTKKHNTSLFSNYFQHRELLILFFYTIIVSLLNANIYGMRPAALLLILQAITGVLFYFSLPLFFKTQDDLIRLYIYVSPIVLINFIGQIIVISSKVEIFALFFEANLKYSEFSGFTVVRSVYSPFISIFVFAYSLYLLEKNEQYISKTYLLIIVIISFFSIILSGTRSWSIAFMLIILIWLFIANIKNKFKIIVFGIGVITLISYTTISHQFDSALERLGTASNVLKNVEAGKQTGESRLEKRLPFVLKGFNMNPIFGLGMNNMGYKYSDLHVGLATNLVRFGIVGMTILLAFWLKFLIKVLKAKKFNREILIFNGLFLGLIVIHTLGRIVFSFTDPTINMILPIILLYTNYHIGHINSVNT